MLVRQIQSSEADLLYRYKPAWKGEISMTTMTNSQTYSGKPVISHSTAVTHTAFRLKDPASAITHFIGMIAAISAAPFLLEKAVFTGNAKAMIASSLFILSMILLYGASTFYHAIITNDKATLLLKKLDHIMIYFLIAGSYTPVCMLVLPARTGTPLCAVVWCLAFAGLFLTICWVDSPKWLNSTIYIAMGWLCIFAIRSIYHFMSPQAFTWLFAGGVIYTIGGVIYALKLPVFNKLHPGFGGHEIFHLFVMGGSLCHFIMVYGYLLS